MLLSLPTVKDSRCIYKSQTNLSDTDSKRLWLNLALKEFRNLCKFECAIQSLKLRNLAKVNVFIACHWYIETSSVCLFFFVFGFFVCLYFTLENGKRRIRIRISTSNCFVLFYFQCLSFMHLFYLSGMMVKQNKLRHLVAPFFRLG